MWAFTADTKSTPQCVSEVAHIAPLALIPARISCDLSHPSSALWPGWTGIDRKDATVTAIDIEGLSVEDLERLRDTINQRLLQLRYSSQHTLPELLRMLEEVKSALSDQGKEWRSLERWQWMDGQIRFWLNPTDQVRYQAGWYTIDELILWSQNRGPILVSFEEDDEEDNSWTEVDGVRIRWLPDGTMERL